MRRFLIFCLLMLPCIAQAQTDATAASSGEQASTYRLQVGDRVDTSYTYTPEYNQSVLVTMDGTVGLTRLGQVNVAGLTLAEADVKITKAAKSSGLNDPKIFLTLTDYLRPQFTVLGNVEKPGKYEMRGPLRVADGLAIAGGLTVSAKHKNILVIHPLDQETGTTTLFSYKDLERKKGEVDFARLSPGDIIIVPTGDLAKVERVVKILNFGIFYNPF